MKNTAGAVALGMVAMACVTLLVALNRPLTGIMAVISSVTLPILGLLWAKLDHVKDQTNGTQTRLIELVEGLSAQVAAMPPAPPGAGQAPPLPNQRDQS